MIKLKYLGETNTEFEKDKEYVCVYLEIIKGKSPKIRVRDGEIIKEKNFTAIIKEINYATIEDFAKNWEIIKEENNENQK